MKTNTLKTVATVSTTVLGLMILGLVVLGCPIRTEHKIETISRIEAHIILDIRQIQAEAASVESEVREELEEPDDEAGDSSSFLSEENFAPRAAARSIWSIFDFSTVAYAADPVEEAKARRKARIKKVDAALTKGGLGENNKGQLETRPSTASTEEKKAVKALIKEENKDRVVIYVALAKKQGLDAKKADLIGEIFAGEIRKKLKKGQAFQVPAKEDHYQAFLKTKQGKALGKPKKGAWVKAP